MDKRKMAILIRGQSANEFYSHKKIKRVNWENFKVQYEKLIEKYSEHFAIDVFLHTYKSNFLDENKLINFYKPKAYSITTSPTNTNAKAQSLIGKNILTSVKSVIEVYFDYCNINNQTYDVVLMMRYDWLPDVKTDFNLLDPNNYNVYGIFVKNGKTYSDDNILFTSSFNLNKYYSVLCQNYSVGNLHWVVNYLDKQKLFDMYSLNN